MARSPFLHIDEISLVQDLRQAVVELVFEKKDGSQGSIKATLQDGYSQGARPLTNEERAGRVLWLYDGKVPENPNVLHVWAVEEKGWRSIRLDRILAAQMTHW